MWTHTPISRWDQNPTLSQAEAVRPTLSKLTTPQAELTAALLSLAARDPSRLEAALDEPERVARAKVLRFLTTIAHLGHLAPSYVDFDVECPPPESEEGERAVGHAGVDVGDGDQVGMHVETAGGPSSSSSSSSSSSYSSVAPSCPASQTTPASPSRFRGFFHARKKNQGKDPKDSKHTHKSARIKH